MSMETDRITEAFYEKPKRIVTWSGIPVKEIYTPKDIEGIDYTNDIADAGNYPFTRGIHPNMYRGRLWTKRAEWGYGSAEDSNLLFKTLLKEGATGITIYRDLPSGLGIDSDHPLARGEVGECGPPLCSLEDMEAVTEDLPLDKLSVTIACASSPSLVILAQYLATAERRGISQSNLRGTLTNDAIVGHFCYSPVVNPVNLAVKVSTDIIEYCVKNMPLWNPLYVSSFYNLREAGALTAPQELAFGLGVALTYIEGVLDRGLKIDDFAPKASVYAQAGIDIFEEAAKLRALRKMWAKIMRERFDAKDPRSYRLRIAIQTTGSQLVPQQPQNNIIRIAYQQLAAVLGGVQSLTSSTYDEAISVPTKEAQVSALRSQQILAYETSVPLVVDPLAGSYYIEWLTNEIENEATKILEEIDAMGGMAKAIESGWVERQIVEASFKYQRETESGERILVGQNRFVSPPEEDVLPGGVVRVLPEVEERQITKVKELKQKRDHQRVKKAIGDLRVRAEAGENLLPPIIECVKAYATIGEIMGTVRESLGYSYDPFGERKSGF